MGKKKLKKPCNAIVVRDRTAVATKPSRWFTSIGYKLVVGVSRRTVGMETKETPTKVIGQALGLRNDGQAFFSKVDLPWIWGDKWVWQPLALKRLQTFLSDECRCVAKDGDILVCKFHEEWNIKWNLEDIHLAEVNKAMLRELDNMPLPTRTPGPLDMLRVLNLMYPWCRYDVNKNEWACLICSMRQDAFNNNTSYRNQFIFKHAECGNSLGRFHVPKVADDVRMKAIREAMESLENSMQLYGRAAASEKAYQALHELLAVGADPGKYLEPELNPDMLKS